MLTKIFIKTLRSMLWISQKQDYYAIIFVNYTYLLLLGLRRGAGQVQGGGSEHPRVPPSVEQHWNVFLWEEEVRGCHLLPEESQLSRSLRLEDPLQPGPGPPLHAAVRLRFPLLVGLYQSQAGFY